MVKDTFNLKNNLDSIDALEDISMELIISQMMEMCEDVKGVIGDRLKKLESLKKVYLANKDIPGPEISDSIKLASLKDIREHIKRIEKTELSWGYTEYFEFLKGSFEEEMVKVKECKGK